MHNWKLETGLVLRCTLGYLLIACAIAAPLAAAQDCEAYFPFDGSLADTASGGNGQMIAADGSVAAPEYVDGQNGQALAFTGKTAMRAYLDLHPDICPELTISAWVRVDPAVRATRVVVSTGNPQSPGMRISGGSLTANGPANGLHQKEVFRPQGGWTFVAVIYDFKRKVYRLHWRGREIANDLTDNWRAPEEALWVGAMTDKLAHPAVGVAIDDLRITGRALTTDQLAELRRGAAGKPPTEVAATGTWQGASCNAHDDCGEGNYCGLDRKCHPDGHAPMADTGPRIPAAGTSGSGTTLEDMRARNQLDPATGAAISERVAESRPPTLGGTTTTSQNAGRLSPETEAEIARRVAENRPPEIGYASEEEAEEARQTREREAEQERERLAYETEQLPAPTINAVIDLQTLSVKRTFERQGDEYYLVKYPLRGHIGKGDRIYFFDYGDQVFPILAGEDWAKAGQDFDISQAAGRFSFTNLAPFEVYGFVAVLMEANRNTVEEQTYAFGFGEFQNEAGVTQTVSSAFNRAVPRDINPPDYTDTSCKNINAIVEQVEAGILQHFGDFTNTNRGLAKAIQDVIAKPLERNRRDRLAGVMWQFYINVPGGERGRGCMNAPEPALFPPPETRFFLDFDYTRIYGEHRQ